LNHPMLLQSLMQLDVGFTCFSLFCVVSTLASLGIHAPDAISSSGLWSSFAGKLGLDRVLALVAVFWVGFSVLFFAGMTTPVMLLRLTLDRLYAPHGPLPETMFGIPLQPVIENLHLPELANSDVSISCAISSLYVWARRGEANSVLAFVMLGFFVIALTIADMAVLGCIAVRLRAQLPVRGLAKAAVALRKLSMLDVLIAGVVVVTMCTSIYHKDGIFVWWGAGLHALLCAEALHYSTYYLVLGAVPLYEPIVSDEAACRFQLHEESDSDLGLRKADYL